MGVYNRYFFRLEELIEAYERYGTIRDAAKEIGIPYHVAYRALRVHASDVRPDTPRRYNKLSPELRQKLIELYREHGSVRKASKLAGVPYATAHRFLTLEGIHKAQARS